jgi:hypothetical protein
MNETDQQMIALHDARSKLLRTWLLGAGLICLVLAVECVLKEAWKDRWMEVWWWVLPNLVPTLSLMLAVYGSDALSAPDPDEVVRRSFLSVATRLSIAYPFMVLLSIALEPFSSYDVLTIFTMSNLWLGPLQGLVVGAIGVLFLTRQGRRAPDGAPRGTMAAKSE